MKVNDPQLWIKRFEEAILELEMDITVDEFTKNLLISAYKSKIETLQKQLPQV